MHLRDVLRTNLTDPLSRAGTAWIFKSRREDDKIRFPHVVVTQDNIASEKFTFSNCYSPPSVDIGITIWANRIQDRDNIADEIVTIFKDVTSSDGTDTIGDNKLQLASFTTSENDIFTEERTIRVKNLTMVFEFYGS